MRKIYEAYYVLKKCSNYSVYLFRNGCFFNSINEDAHLLSSIFKLKITTSKDGTIEVGFPLTSLDKFAHILKLLDYEVVIVLDVYEEQLAMKMLDSIDLKINDLNSLKEKVNKIINM